MLGGRDRAQRSRPPDQLERLRMQRQRVFDAGKPLRLTAMFEESVLDRPIGGARCGEAVRGQIAHLLELGKRENVEILVPAHLGGQARRPGGPVHAAAHPQRRPVRAGAVHRLRRDPRRRVYVQDQRQEGIYLRSAEQIRGVALSRAQSAKLLGQRLAART